MTDFENHDFSERHPFDDEVFEGAFTRCNFSDANLTSVAFVECVFDGCNLSMARLVDSRLQDVVFKNCKLMGVDFSVCNPFGLAMRFEECNLDFASFDSLKIPRTRFKDCTLREANFTRTDLKSASFSGCDLSLAVFRETNLESADLRGATGFAIDPALNRVRKLKVSRTELEGFLHAHQLDID